MRLLLKKFSLLSIALFILAACSNGSNSSEFARDVDPKSNKLVGVRNLDVNGKKFNVAFVRGTCIDSFDGCDSDSDFPFRTRDATKAAAEALLNHVFIDSPEGKFDSDLGLLNGIEHTVMGCVQIMIPFDVLRENVTNMTVKNCPENNKDDLISGQTVFREASFDSVRAFVWAEFSPAKG